MHLVYVPRDRVPRRDLPLHHVRRAHQVVVRRGAVAALVLGVRVRVRHVLLLGPENEDVDARGAPLRLAAPRPGVPSSRHPQPGSPSVERVPRLRLVLVRLLLLVVGEGVTQVHHKLVLLTPTAPRTPAGPGRASAPTATVPNRA